MTILFFSNLPLTTPLKFTLTLSSGLGKNGIDILKSRIKDKEYMSRVENLIDMCPIKLYRGFSGTTKFINLIKNDLRISEKIVCYGFSNSKVQRLNLTLYQILFLQEINDKKEPYNLFGSDITINKIIEKILSKIDTLSFSRHILLNLIRQDASIDELFKSRGIEFDKSIYYNLLETRVNISHLHINIADTYNLIEITPERDQNSPLFHQYLMKHLSILTNRAEKDSFGKELVKKIKHNKSWGSFINHHLSLMSEIYARRLADLPIKIEEHFLKAKKSNKFKEISDLLSEYWR